MINFLAHRMHFITLMIVTLIPFQISGQASGEPHDSFVIGVLVNPMNREDVVFGATMAMDEINGGGGIDGRKVELNIKTVEGPWGKGSEAIVELVFKDRAVAIIGSLEGKNTHMAEQVIAKTQVVYVSSWASESSLSQAFVPWYFSIVPTDDQQARMILSELQKTKDPIKLLVVYASGFDGERASQSFAHLADEKGGFQIRFLEFRDNSTSISQLAERLLTDEANALVLLGSGLPVLQILETTSAAGHDIEVFANHQVLGHHGSVLTRVGLGEKLKVVLPGDWQFEESGHFKEAYHQTFHRQPGVVAAYAYDGVMTLARALRESDSKGISLEDAMSQIQYQGLTGRIEFDGSGKLKYLPQLAEIRE